METVFDGKKPAKGYIGLAHQIISRPCIIYEALFNES